MNKINKIMDLSKIKNRVEYINLLDIQLNSYNSFWNINDNKFQKKDKLIYKVLTKHFNVMNNKESIILVNYYITPPIHTIEECVSLKLTYCVALYIKLKITKQESIVFYKTLKLGYIPYIT